PNSSEFPQVTDPSDGDIWKPERARCPVRQVAEVSAAPESGHAASYHLPLFLLAAACGPSQDRASMPPDGPRRAVIRAVPGTEALTRRRPHRCPALAHPGGRGPGAGLVDPAGAGHGDAGGPGAVPGSARAAHGLGPADPRHVVPPRRS